MKRKVCSVCFELKPCDYWSIYSNDVIAPGNTACGDCLGFMSVFMPMMEDKKKLTIMLRVFQKIFVKRGLMEENVFLEVTK